jgi:hypothetical protein
VSITELRTVCGGIFGVDKSFSNRFVIETQEATAMGAYIVVILELLILAAGFWYTFLYEPKPPKIIPGLWGQYRRNATPSPVNPIVAIGSNWADRARRNRPGPGKAA